MKKIIAASFLLLFIYSCSGSHYKVLNISTIPRELRVPAASSGYIALRVEIPEEMHIYGDPKGPGIGKPTTITVRQSGAVTFSEARFLPPEKYYSPGDRNHVWIYRDETTIFIPFQTGKTVRPGPYVIKITFDALLCNSSICVPVFRELDYTINIIGSGIAATPPDGRLESLYRESSSPAEISSIRSKDEKPSAGALTQIPDFSPRFLSEKGIYGLLHAVLLGIIAGLFLNFMPCVLPVVSLKVMSFVMHSGESRRRLVNHGIIYSAGILTSFMVLSSLAAYLEYNWGGLFQRREFLTAMIAVVFVLSLSMFDVFILNIPSLVGKAEAEAEVGLSGGYAGSYAMGLLATLLATPCSGPFLGGTLAWSLTQSPAVIFTVFMSVGIGMSLPFIILTANPALLKFIPKPGPWNITLERIMGFLLVGTTIYLIDILEETYVMPTLWFLAFLGIAFWQYGMFGSLLRSRVSRIVSCILVIVITAFGYIFSYNYLYTEGAFIQVKKHESFSLKGLYGGRDRNSISIVKFTADWCPNCKLVEKTALYTAEVIDIINNRGITLYTADLTRKNPEAEGLLYKLGSRSIPFLAVFPAGSGFYNPVCLRDIYTKNNLINAIGEAVKGISGVSADAIKFGK
jgi:thiol:disulfide interchange protein